MRVKRHWRRWAVVALSLVLALGAVRLLDRESPILYYRVVDDHTLLVGTISGSGATVRVTDLSETATTVTITVRSFYIQLGPGTGAGTPFESVATLREAIGTREVIDGSSGQPVGRGTCPPPAVFAPACA